MILILQYLGALVFFFAMAWLLNRGMEASKWKFARFNRFTRQLVINALLILGGIARGN